MQKYLVMSKKSSNFAPAFENEGLQSRLAGSKAKALAARIAELETYRRLLEGSTGKQQA